MNTPSAYFIPGRRVDIVTGDYFRSVAKWRLVYRVPPFSSVIWCIMSVSGLSTAHVDESRLMMPAGLQATMRKLIKKAR